ncbi:MAG: hypothetical protein ACEPOZ_07440 [Marinifilaceae bacterium]
MRKILPLLTLILGVYLTSCSSGEKALEKGNYYQAVMKSVSRLRSNPNKTKAQQTLLKSYPMAVNWYEQQINHTLAANGPLKWTQVVDKYQTLNRLAQEIDRCPAAKNLISSPHYYMSELENAKSQAGPECYKAGEQALAKGTREGARTAYHHFVKANEFVPNYRDVLHWIEESKYLATLKVVVEQIPLPSAKYRLSADFFQDQVDKFIGQSLGKEFVRFYSPEEAENEKLEVLDQIVRIQFEDFVVGETHELANRKVVTSQDSVKVGEITLKDGSKVDVLNRVKAKLTVHKREVISKGLLNLQIVDFRSNRILSHERIPGEFVWFTQWGHFNGDERALTPKEIDICKQEPVPAPAPQDLFIEFTKPIYTQLTSKLKSFYRRY